MEIWKEIAGFEGIYQISSRGNIKSFKGSKSGRVLSNKNSKGGYLSVVLSYNGRRRYTRIHTLVAEAFLKKKSGQTEVNHIDGNRQNNDISNLEWCTHSHNIRHSVLNNKNHVAGLINYNRFIKPKKINQLSLDGKLIAVYTNGAEASRLTGVCHRNIIQVCNKTEYKPGLFRKQAGGYRWEFGIVTEGRNREIGY